MQDKMRDYSPGVHQYIRDNSLRLPTAMAELMEKTSKMPHAMMATAPEQCQFLHFLMKSNGAKRAIEVGVFTGVGTMWMANAVGDDGLVIACDSDAERTLVAKEYWDKGAVANRIKLCIAPAQKTLQDMIDKGDAGSFDFCYIDADKEGYKIYYELCLQLLRPGGIIAFDNMLSGGHVADPHYNDGHIPRIRALNKYLHTDKRVDVSFLAIGDGLYLARKCS